ncbi:hypothetical protein HanIR_Chr09g0403761 [Helianthus annuus]|nr:hypothetical protein HanIR_Chr09g0403761 [Helianthus annuus]
MKGQPPPWRRHTAADVERKREISSEREELEERGRDRQTECVGKWQRHRRRWRRQRRPPFLFR